jgi:hypothetical protein
MSADDDYYPPLVHRSRFRPDETPFDLPDGLSVGSAPTELMGQPTTQTPFELMNAAPVNPFGGDSQDYTTAHVKADYDREQDYLNSPFGKIANAEVPEGGGEAAGVLPALGAFGLANRALDNANNPQLEGGGASVFGKMLGAVGLDGDGSRANTTWGQSLGNTATMFNPFAMAADGVKSASRWVGATKYPEKLETPDMLAPFGGAAMVAPFAPVNAIGMLGGRLSKNPAHQAAIKRAEEMAAQGASRDDIWAETRVVKTKDGHWKVEFDDSNDFHLKAPLPDAGESAWLEDVFSAPSTQAAYPVMYGGTEIMRGAGGHRGMWQHGDVRPEGVVIPHSLQVGKGATRSTVGHEVQHGIQREEGWATGGSTYGAFPSDGKGGAWPIYRERLKSMTTPTSLEDYAKAAGYDNPADAVADHAKHVKALETMRKNGVPAHLDRAAQESAAQDWYNRLAGEAEARAVQKRMHMTQEERAARPFWLDYDVPESEQIVRFGGSEFNSESSPFSPRGAEAPSGANSPDSLPMDEASSYRAKFEPGWYHGTDTRNIKAFQPRNQSGGVKATYLTQDRPFARRFTERGNVMDLMLNREGFADLANPEHLARIAEHYSKATGISAEDALKQVEGAITNGRMNWANRYATQAAQDAGFKGIDLNDSYGTSTAVFDPSHIRSPFAAFDPAKSSSSNLLAADQNRASIPGVIVQAAERAGADESPFSLPMDEASRLARADAAFEKPTWYHATTHDFSAFDPNRANIEGHLGRSNYLTSSPEDAGRNYGTPDGPDITNRIEQLAERIAQDDEFDGDMDAARQFAKKQIAGSSDGAIMPLRVRKDMNTLRLDKDRIDFSSAYDEAADDYTENPNLLKVHEALQDAADEFHDLDIAKVMEDLHDMTYDEVKASDFDKALRSSEGLAYATDAEGTLVSSEIIRRIYQSLGYDAVEIDAGATFPRMEGTKGARHLMVFDPKNLRSPFAAFDPAKSDSPFLLAADQAKASLPGVFTQAAEREGKGPFEQTPKGISAYHGSPHDFDRFSLDKIGTGEGAQAYGHGLYFADNEGVAKSYRDALTGNHAGDQFIPTVDGQHVPDASPTLKNILRNGGDPARFIESMQPKLAALRDKVAKADPDDALGLGFSDREMAQIELASAQKLVDEAQGYVGKKLGQSPPGRMYEVRINADPEHFLDWDKPLSQQSEAVRAAFANMHPDDKGTLERLPHASGAVAYSMLKMPHAEQASRNLNEAGIPGIRYLDQGSRGAGEGSSNYVVFDDKLVEILRKYGILAPPVGAGLLGATKGEDDEG